jgi:hypothetical protein
VFGLQILDVVIGLFFGYLVLSLVVTAGNELFAAWFRRRAWMLRKGIRNLLGDDRLAGEFYGHPLIRSLSADRWGPSYIPSRTFAITLLDVVSPRTSVSTPPPSRDAAKSPLDHTLALLWEESGGDAVRFRQHVETWFNDGMERVSGWYKRRTQFMLLIWAAVVTIGTNADTLVIARALWRDTALRQAVVTSAERYLAEESRPAAPVVAAASVAGDGGAIPPLPPDQQADIDFELASTRYDAAMADLAELQLPIGWEDPSMPAAEDGDLDEPRFRLIRDDATDDWPGPIWAPGGAGRWYRAFDQHLLGWLLTILAISLGAPFWFDTLNRVIAIRSAGKAPEEAPRAPREVPKPKEPGDERP